MWQALEHYAFGGKKMKTLSPSERLKTVDEALELCKLVRHTSNHLLRLQRQAQALLALAKIQRADMSIFRDHLGLDNLEFAQCLFFTRRLLRTGELPPRDSYSLLEQEIRNQFYERNP
jgi:hypothetical protein